MKSRLVLSRLALLVGLSFVGMTNGSETRHASNASVPIYTDALASGWADWSWSTLIDWQDSTSPHTGSHDVAFTFDNAWDGLSMHDDGAIDTSPYDELQFWINGGAAGGQALSVFLESGGSELSGPIDIGPYIQGGSIVANAWRLVHIPLGVLGASDTSIDRLNFFNNTDTTQPELLLDDLALYDDGKAPPPPTTVHVSVAVNTKMDAHSISPYIYGVAFAAQMYLKANNLTVERWGGNATTRYNWRLGSASNTAADWYFENTDGNNSCTAPSCAVDEMVTGDRSAQAASLITVPTIGWVAKNASLDTCGFAVSKYGPQQRTDPYRSNCGNGLKPNGTPITGNDPTDTSVKSTPAGIKPWIQHLVSKFGTAAHGGVKFYAMDNEPELWNSTHRDVHPQPLTYDGLYDEFESYASVVRQVDPTAMIDGPIPWGWSAYFDSTYDYANNTTSDRQAHGNLPIIPWFLRAVRAHDQKAGERTLNVLDVHYYPQEHNVFGSANDPATDALRLRSTRSLWDPTYIDESWIGDKVDLIPRMKAWIAEYYPGTKFGISEWNFGDEAGMNGALAIADVLGILGRENVYLASYWTHPNQNTPATRAFDMFRNYNGHDGTFGNESIRAASSAPNSLMSFGAVRTKDHHLTLMLVNQEPSAQAVTSISLKKVKVGATVQDYVLTKSGGAIQRLTDMKAAVKMHVTVPPYTVELLVIPT